jgi:type IV pilus assembly protein PilM
MMPWNPIHRYAGLQSSIDPITPDPAGGELNNGVTSDPFGNAGSRDLDVSFGHATGFGAGSAAEASRRPLGFVDVRSESGDGSTDAFGSPELEGGADTSTDEVGHARAAEPEAELEEKVPFFKREISLRRRREGDAPEIAESSHEDAAVASVAESDEPTAIQFAAESVATESDDAEPFVAQPASVTEDDSLAATTDEHGAENASQVEAAGDTDIEDAEQVSEVADGLEWPEHPAPAAEVVTPEPLDGSETESAGPPDLPEPVETPVAVAAAKAPLRSFGRSRGTKTSPGGRGGQRRGGRVVGLKIGASQLAAAVVEEQNGRPELVELARTPLEAGIVVDGEIRDPEALTNALRSFFADHKLPTKDVRIGIASNRIGVRTLDIAGVDDPARFDNAVRFKAHEVLPIAGSESVLDYRVLDERQSPTGETTRRILLVVAPRDQVAPYAEAAQRAGLKLAGIDLESLGLLRAFVEPQDPGARKATDTATVVVAIGHEASTLMVSGSGVCEFTRVFDWGGNTLQEAIVQELDVRPAEAATILRHLSLAGNSVRIEGLDDETRGKAVEAVRLRLTPFARELVSSLQFYQTQPDSLGIGEIVITGGASQLDGLADALHQMIGVAVRVGDPLQRVAARKGVEAGFEHVIGSLSVAIGLAIDDGAIRSVNLMPGDLAKVSTSKTSLLPVLLPIAAVIPLAAVGFLFYQGHAKVSDRQSQLATLNADFAKLPEPKGPQIDAALQGIQAQRASAVAQVLGARVAWDTMLADFARVLPSNVWLTALSAKTSRPLSTATVVAVPTGATTPVVTPPTTTAVSPTGVTITGYTYAQPDVASLLARLSALPSLQNVQLQSSQVATVGKRDVVQFTILADLRETGGGS